MKSLLRNRQTYAVRSRYKISYETLDTIGSLIQCLIGKAWHAHQILNSIDQPGHPEASSNAALSYGFVSLNVFSLPRRCTTRDYDANSLGNVLKLSKYLTKRSVRGHCLGSSKCQPKFLLENIYLLGSNKQVSITFLVFRATSR